MSDKLQNQIAPRSTSPLISLGQRFSIAPEKLLEVLRGTVIKPSKNGGAASNEEIAAFCIVANQYGLNPFTREIHAFTSGEKGVVPIVGIDGWAKIINSHEQFDGCEFEEEDDEDGAPLKKTCIMYVKGRSHPVKVTERMSECKRNTIPWNTMPHRMLRHKAFMQAGRYAFSIAGLFDEDEARDVISVESKIIDPLSSDRPLTAEELAEKRKKFAERTNGHPLPTGAETVGTQSPDDELPMGDPVKELNDGQRLVAMVSLFAIESGDTAENILGNLTSGEREGEAINSLKFAEEHPEHKLVKLGLQRALEHQKMLEKKAKKGGSK